MILLTDSEKVALLPETEFDQSDLELLYGKIGDSDNVTFTMKHTSIEMDNGGVASQLGAMVITR